MDRNIEVDADETAEGSAGDYLDLTADLVAAYLSNNPVRVADIPGLIAGVHTALSGLDRPTELAEPEVKTLTPAQIRRSIKPDGIVSFIDGKSYKTLKRHLTKHRLTPATYRTRYGLPSDYPMTAASYSEARSTLAKGLGLGRKRDDADAAINPSED